jgi:hypothetical protein
MRLEVAVKKVDLLFLVVVAESWLGPQGLALAGSSSGNGCRGRYSALISSVLS